MKMKNMENNEFYTCTKDGGGGKRSYSIVKIKYLYDVHIINRVVT